MSNLIIKLKGGTGNQLFQILAAITLAKINKKRCQFCIEDINKNKYNRKLEILPVIKYFEIDKKELNSPQYGLFFDQHDIDHPIYFSKTSPLASYNSDIYIEGYFTNYRIHDKVVVEKLKSLIKNFDSIKQFGISEFIAIHVRELHGTGSNKIKNNIDNLNISYYSQSLNMILKKSSKNKVKNAIVFSDMWKNKNNSILLPKIKELLKNLGINYIDGDDKINCALDIVNILSIAKYTIISNSSLSWWGGYLSEGEVFSPVMSLWDPDLKIPDKWHQIYSNEITPRTHHNKLIFEPSILTLEEKKLRDYNLRRLKIIKFTRKLSAKFKLKKSLGIIIRWFKKKGILSENPYSTYF